MLQFKNWQRQRGPWLQFLNWLDTSSRVSLQWCLLAWGHLGIQPKMRPNPQSPHLGKSSGRKDHPKWNILQAQTRGEHMASLPRVSLCLLLLQASAKLHIIHNTSGKESHRDRAGMVAYPSTCNNPAMMTPSGKSSNYWAMGLIDASRVSIALRIPQHSSCQHLWREG